MFAFAQCQVSGPLSWIEAGQRLANVVTPVCVIVMDFDFQIFARVWTRQIGWHRLECHQVLPC